MAGPRAGAGPDSVASSGVGGPCPGVSSENICLSSALSETSLLESEEAALDGLETQPEQDE